MNIDELFIIDIIMGWDSVTARKQGMRKSALCQVINVR
jgi:hypothetical protein